LNSGGSKSDRKSLGAGHGHECYGLRENWELVSGNPRRMGSKEPDKFPIVPFIMYGNRCKHLGISGVISARY
jgi:hypothetical protein